MSNVVKNDTLKVNAPSDYAKLYFKEKPKQEGSNFEPIFQDTFIGLSDNSLKPDTKMFFENKECRSSDYAKLYFKEETKQDSPDFDSMFKEAFPFDIDILYHVPNQKTKAFFENKKSLPEKIFAGGEAILMSFVPLVALFSLGGGCFLNKLPDHVFDKIAKPIAPGIYTLCILFGFLAYNSVNKYNKNLNKLSELYAKSDQKEQKQIDKEVDKLYNAANSKEGLIFLDTRNANKKMEDLIEELENKLSEKNNSSAKNN